MSRVTPRSRRSSVTSRARLAHLESGRSHRLPCARMPLWSPSTRRLAVLTAGQEHDLPGGQRTSYAPVGVLEEVGVRRAWTQRFAEGLLDLVARRRVWAATRRSGRPDDLVDVVTTSLDDDRGRVVCEPLESSVSAALPRSVSDGWAPRTRPGRHRVLDPELLEELDAEQQALLVTSCSDSRRSLSSTESRIASVITKPPRDLDLDLMGPLVRIGRTEHRLEEIRVEDQRSRSSRTASTCTCSWMSSIVLGPSTCHTSLPCPVTA